MTKTYIIIIIIIILASVLSQSLSYVNYTLLLLISPDSILLVSVLLFTLTISGIRRGVCRLSTFSVSPNRLQ
jgi:polyferredoxin